MKKIVIKNIYIFWVVLLCGGVFEGCSPKINSSTASTSINKVRIDRLPNNLEEFKALKIFNLSNPYNTAALFIVALTRFNESPEQSIDMINLLKGKPLGSYDIGVLNKKMTNKKHYLAQAYFWGAFPNNNYTPNLPYTIIIEKNKSSFTEPDYITLYVRTSGADLAKPITLKQKGNQWYLWEFSEILGGVKEPNP